MHIHILKLKNVGRLVVQSVFEWEQSGNELMLTGEVAKLNTEKYIVVFI